LPTEVAGLATWHGAVTWRERLHIQQQGPSHRLIHSTSI